MTVVLGRACDVATLEPTGQETALDPATLTRHAVCVGMTGSGKTGLCVSVLESIASAGVPILALDPKGDLANLALQFPDLEPAALLPWLDPMEAQRAGVSMEALALQTAERWRIGLDAAGIDRQAHRRFVDGVDVAVFTPGSEAGLPVNVVAALTHAPEALQDDAEGLREYVTGAVTALLELVDEPSDPLTDPPAILLCRLLLDAFAAGHTLPFGQLLARVLDPPLDRLGYFDVDEFLPPEARQALALKLNALAASPAFAAWRTGVPLDLPTLLTPAQGRTPIRVMYLAHLSEPQRMFFVSMLLHAVVAWSRRLGGTSSLRALIYFDEVFGYLPPHPKSPPSKGPLLALMKQARSVGVGVMLATQNPVDLDYKALSNAGTWLVGRLQTPQDRQRVAHGLVDAGVEDASLGELLGRLPGRTFVWRTPQGRGGVVRSRFCMSFLRGPLTRREVASLVTESMRHTWATRSRPRPASPGLSPRPPRVPEGLQERWLVEDLPEETRASLGTMGHEEGERAWRLGLLLRVDIRYDEGAWAHEERVDLWLARGAGPHALEVTRLAPLSSPFEATWVRRDAPPGGDYEALPEGLTAFGGVVRWKEEVCAWVAMHWVYSRADGAVVRPERGDVRVQWAGVVWWRG